MSTDRSPAETPLYCLDSFSAKARDNAFYIEKLKTHLKNHVFVSKPHKHDFYLLLYITQGSGDHIIDFKNYSISPGTFFLMTPGQVHSWNLDEHTDGFIIFFLKDFYRMHLSENSLIEFPFFHALNANPCIRLGKDHTVDVIIHDMYDEFKKTSPLDQRLLRSYLDLLLLKLARKYPGSPDGAISPSAFKLRKLEQLIEKHYLKLKRPGDYADLMNLSPSYLNQVCRQNVGKTLSDLIHERVILEAKRLFAYTDMTVNQVSHRLNFAEPSYFIRFFKKETGLTPDQFKETLIRAIQ
jgi:AraC-like DNA-binding protein